MPILGPDKVDHRARLFGDLAPLFDDRFVRSCDLYEEFTFRLVIEAVRKTGLDGHLVRPVTAAELCRAAGLAEDRALVPVDGLLRTLGARGAIDEAGPGRWQKRAPLPGGDPAEIRAAQEAHDPRALPSYDLAAAAAAGYPAFLRGEAKGDELLLGADTAALWFAYFSNDNPLYAINNTIGARAVAAWSPAGDGALRLLELGGGAGSAAVAVIDALREAGRLHELAAYRFTEFAPMFLRRGQRALAAALPSPGIVQAARLDMNLPFAAQGVGPGSVDVVYAVNTLHVAHDLALTLAEIRAALRPGGLLAFAECVRPFPGRPVSPEFIFNLMPAFRAPKLDPALRPNGGFLTPEQWAGLLGAAGFADVRVMPDIAAIRPFYPQFFVAALGATAV